VTFVGGHVRVRNPRAAFVWFQVAAIEALPRGLKVGLAAPASPGGVRITGNNGCVPVEGVAAAYLAGFCRFGVVVGVAHEGEVSKEDAMRRQRMSIPALLEEASCSLSPPARGVSSPVRFG